MQRARIWQSRTVALALAVALLSLGCLPPSRAPLPTARTVDRSAPVHQAETQRAAPSVPFPFEENRGQAHADLAFVLRVGEMLVGYGPQGPTYWVFQGLDAGRPALTDGQERRSDSPPGAMRTVSEELVGGRAALPVGAESAPTLVSYLREGLTHIPTYQQIAYRDAWPGIDVLYERKHAGLKSAFQVRPFADPGQIVLAWHGAEVTLAESGQLEARTEIGVLRQGRPVAWQDGPRGREPVPVAWQRLDPESGVEGWTFQLGSYDRTRELLIDPPIEYATYLGGSGSESAGFGAGSVPIAVDASGAAYVTGGTTSTQATFPDGDGFGTVPGFKQTLSGATDAYVAKFAPNGQSLVYATYLGGTGDESGRDIAVDGAGAAYVAGATSSTEATFPSGTGFGGVPGFDQTSNGSLDAFVVKLAPSGQSLAYATYLGGSSGDGGAGIAVDGSGSAYVAGATSSDQSSFPSGSGFAALPGVPGVDQTFNGSDVGVGGGDGFVVKLNAAGTSLLYATYIGGAAGDDVNDIAIDGAGAAYVTGRTCSGEATFPTGTGFGAIPGFDRTFNGSPPVTVNGIRSCRVDGWIVKLATGGGAISYASYIATDDDPWVAVDGSGSAYMAGATDARETVFPDGDGFGSIPGFLQVHQGSLTSTDAFVVKFAPDGQSLVYATYLGGSSNDAIRGIAVDGSGAAHVTGSTLSSESSFPAQTGFGATPGLFRCFPNPSPSRLSDSTAFMARLASDGRSLPYATYLGGAGSEQGNGIALGPDGRVYVSGRTSSSQTSFPDGDGFGTIPGFDRTFNGGSDAFVAKLDLSSSTQADVSITKTDSPDPVSAGAELTYTLTVRNDGPHDACGVVVTDTLPAEVSFISSSGATCTGSPTRICTINTLAAGASAQITIRVTAQSAGPINNQATVATGSLDPNPSNNTATASTNAPSGPGPAVDLAITKSGPSSAAPGAPLSYTVVVTNNGPSAADAVTVADPTPGNLTFVSNAGDCTTAYPCALGTLAAGQSRTITSTYQVSAGVPNGTSITNVASVSSSVTDTNPSNNSASATTTVTTSSPPAPGPGPGPAPTPDPGSPSPPPPPTSTPATLADVSVTKVGPASLVPGTEVTYLLTVTNQGPGEAAGVRLDDPAPSGLSFLRNTGDCVTAFPCTLGTLAAGQQRTVSATFQVSSGAAGQITNVATVSSSTADPNPSNNTASLGSTVSGSAQPLGPTLTPSPTPSPTPQPVVRERDPQPRKLTEEQRQQQQRTDRSSQDDTHIEGDILSINTLVEPPELVIGTRDGRVTLRLHEDAAEVARGAQVGQYFVGRGEKQHEGLWDVYGGDAK